MLLVLAGGLLMASSCTKTGPTGPQGPTGNANVIGENSFIVSAWQHTGNTYFADFQDDNITSAVSEHGSVEIYKYYSGTGGGWTNLPDINAGASTVYNFSTGGFTISVFNIDGSTTAFPGTVEFRVVVIPSSYKQAYPHTNWKNYEETMNVMAQAKARGL